MPYRTPPGPALPEPPPGGSDERVILWAGVVIGGVACIPQLADGGRWSAQPTLGLLLAATSGALLAGDTLSRLLERRRARRADRERHD
jgi:hypothetical protein